MIGSAHFSRLTIRSAIFLAASLPIVLSLRAQAQNNDSQPTFSARPVSGTTAPGKTMDMKAAPPASTLGRRPVREIPRGTPFTPGQERALKDHARRRALQAPAQTGGNGPSAPARPGGRGTPSASQAFFPPNTASQQNFCNSFIPSDMAVAASTDFVVQVTNSCIVVLSASGGALLSGPTALCSFFAVSCDDNVGDPRALYDPNAGVFIVIAEDFTANNLLIAASTSGDPTSTYNLHSVPMGLACGGGGDFPMAGQTLQESGDALGALYVSWNEFCPGGTFTNDVIAFAKSQVYSTNALTLYGFINITLGGVPLDHIQPVNVMNKSDRPRAEFLISTLDFGFGGGQCINGCNGLVVLGFYNTISGSAVFSGILIPTANTYFLPPNADQPGCTSGSCLINTGPPAITGTVNYSSGQLYAAISTGGNFAGAGTLFWQVHPTLNDAGNVTGATILNEICACGVFRGSGSMYYATVQPDSEGNFTVAYNFSSTVDFPGIAYLTQRVTQATGAFEDFGFFLAAGSAFYQQLDMFGRNRWGDYTGTAFSQTIPNSYWFSGEYSDPTQIWDTAIGENGYTDPSQP